MMRSNCLIFALWMWLTHPGSYLLVRWSTFYPGPHFLWGVRRATGGVRVVHYVPKHPRRRRFPPLLFAGRVKRGDQPGATHEARP